MNKFIEWLSENWIGGVIGAIIPYLWMAWASKWGLYGSSAVRFLCILGLFDSYGCSFKQFMINPTHLIFAGIDFLIGAFIYSLFRRIK